MLHSYLRGVLGVCECSHKLRTFVLLLFVGAFVAAVPASLHISSVPVELLAARGGSGTPWTVRNRLLCLYVTLASTSSSSLTLASCGVSHFVAYGLGYDYSA